MPARYKGAPRPGHPWSQATVLVRMGRHLPTGNTARPDRYEQSFMAIGSLIYGDKRCALSALYANWLKAWKEREGCCPFHLLLPVRVTIDGTSPHLPPLTERMNEERSHIYTHGISPMRGTQYTTHRAIHCLILLFLLLFSFLRTNSGIGVPSAHGSQGL